MQRKRSIHIPKGMTKDMSDSKIGSEYYIDALNIRLTVDKDNSLLSITNAKGNEMIGTDTEIEGLYVGHAVLNEYIVVFTREARLSMDYIYRIDTNNEYKTILLAYGHFNFDRKYPIETLSMYEKEDVQKVYWIDGKNSPRFINIADKIENGIVKPRENARSASSPTAFDFVTTMNLNEKVTIKRNETTIGTISAGAIQYAFTYYNLYGQESNIFHQSSLFYISYNNRGASPEDTKVSASFTIEMKDLDNSFEFVRIYAIHRTSLNATPTVRRVIDLPVEDSVTFIDGGNSGEIVDPSMLLFMGGRTIIPQTMSHKDGTLFFGNYQEKNSIISNDIKEACKNLTVAYSRLKEKVLEMAPNSGYYSYESGLTKSLDKISTFKYLEYYRFGIQAQKETGEWSEPIFIKDVRNEVPIDFRDNKALLVGASTALPKEFCTLLRREGYIRVRPLVVYPTLADRECICQGVVNPTVFNVEDRKSNSPWCQSSWFFRPNSSSTVDSEGGSGTSPIEMSVYCLCITNAESPSLSVDDHIKLDFYSSVNDTNKKQCSLKVRGYNSYNVKDDSGSSYNYIIIAVEIDDTEYTYEDISRDTSAYKRGDLSVYYDNDSSIGDLMYLSDGNIAVFPSSFLEAVLPKSGEEAEMKWHSNWSYSDKEYTWESNHYFKAPEYMSGGKETVTLSAVFEVTSYSNDAAGTISEFRHWQPLPSARHKNGEIQCNFVSEMNFRKEYNDYNYNFREKIIDINPKNDSSLSLSNDEYVDLFSDMFFVDQSIVTFHSPDIEFDTNTRSVDNSLLKMRIVGYVPITSTVSDVDIQTSTIQLNYRGTTALPRGFWHETVGNIGYAGNGSLNAAAMWYDEEYHGDKNPSGENKRQFTTAFMTYPWHRTGSLNNQNAKDSDNYRSAMLKRKVMSNLRFSYRPYYIEDNTSISSMNDTKFDLSDIALFDSNEVMNSRLNGNYTDPINYYGNIDKIVSSSRVFRIDKDHQVTGYPIFRSGRFKAGNDFNSYHDAFVTSNVEEIRDHHVSHLPVDLGDVSSTLIQQRFGSDPVQIKYKSTIHAVLSLKGSNVNNFKVLPTAKHNDEVLNAVKNYTTPFWSKDVCSINQAVLPINMDYGWLWLVELYNDNVINRFGGTSEDAIENNTWVPCGQPVSIPDTPIDSLPVKWIEGDTFFQRYDCLKTYPFTNEDPNSIVDILSFMCETRVNIDGRYDKNRGQNSNLQMSPINFNLINYVYSQNNNFFNYRTLDRTLFNNNIYKNYITWTKKKTPGEETDTWTNITLANVLDLDGDKGKITALKRFNNSLFAFQDSAFSQILYNENTQISTTAGVPIEIANSGKVEGKRYISETVGCNNKWSIIESPYGIYFMDSNNASINLFNGQLTDLTDKYGFNSWAKNNINKESWDTSFNTFRTFYDRNNKDVYFVNKETALNFSETLNQFVSFISYGNTPAMFNVGNKFYAITHGGYLYDQNGGDYGWFFNQCQPYSITFIDNQDYIYDKTYTNIEFRVVVDPDMNSEKKEFVLPFNTLTAITDYQEGSVEFTPQQSLDYKRYPNLKRKFRIWRADIPRSIWVTEGGIKKQDRMRNPWICLKLEKTVSPGTTRQPKIEMHDLIVDYYL